MMKPPEVDVNQTVPPVIDNEGKSVDEIMETLSEQMINSIATPPPDNKKPPTVNPLKLPFFMGATISNNKKLFFCLKLFWFLVMSFGFMFVIVAVTWYK